MPRFFLFCACLVISPLGLASNSQGWDTFSDIGAYGLVGLAAGLPAYQDDWDGVWQAGLSIGSASAIGLIGKHTIDAPRPDGSDNKSFPSNHTANAFASATTLHIRHGWQVGLPAYGVATLVGVGRVQANKHYWRDVAAGAAIGVFTGWIFTDLLDPNVQLLPWATPHSSGVSVTYVW
ncbi:phosphatase PAP2 family protein [Vibrio cionasavignyae]|uniref:phosphatase PAP2 family protein n=1 Tax=Vibrio cionasavignyae TaxID=2910252 RepID=UPI003D0BD16D